MPALSCMFKTVSDDCNLNCGYCYYRKSQSGGTGRHQISSQVLERFIPQYMDYIEDCHQATFSWQGGEPTLAGLDFFHQVIELEAKYANPGTIITNTLQTNGILLDDKWGRFLQHYNFLVGVSLDGTEEINDQARKDNGGKGSFRRTMRGIKALQRNSVDLNVLTVLGPHNIDRAGELMQFFRKEGLHYLQFMPAMAFQATQPLQPPSYHVTPEQYGEFLITLFDEWYDDGSPTTPVRIFDNFLQSYMGMQNELCVHSATCDSGIIVEYNGDIYPCDFYIHPDWKLGNIFEKSLRDIVESPLRRKFIQQKKPLPGRCASCEWNSICNGGCVRNRLVSGDNVSGTDFFCQSYRRFFRHADSRMKSLSERLRRPQKVQNMSC